MRFGWTEILVILVVILLLFGARRLPELARSIGKSLKEFKKGMKDVTDHVNDDDDDDDKPKKKDVTDHVNDDDDDDKPKK